MDAPMHQQIKVGIFVAIGAVIIIFSVLFLGDDRTFLKSTYELRVTLKHVQGLNKGSMVSLAGLHAGNIETIRFKPGTSDLEAVLQLDNVFRARITEGSIVSVKTLGALGDKYIYIEPGPITAPPIADGGTIASDGAEDFLDVIAKKGDSIGNMVNVISEFQTLLQNLNRNGGSALMMENMVAATGNLNRLLAETREALNQARGDSKSENRLKEVLVHLASIMEKVDKGEGTLGALINDPTLHQKLITLLGDSPRKNYLKPLIRETIQHADGPK